MTRDISGLMEKARSSGEAFHPVLSRDGSRVGLSARQASGSIVLELEVQLRLVPPDTDVDLGALRSVVDAASGLAEAGFHLHHFEGGWIVASRPVHASDLTIMMEKVRRIVLAAH